MDADDKPNFLTSAGIQIDSVPIDVDARILDVPYDTYSKTPGTLAIPYKDKVEFLVVNFHATADDIIPDVNNLVAKLYELS